MLHIFVCLYIIFAFIFCRASLVIYHKRWNPVYLFFIMMAISIGLSTTGYGGLNSNYSQKTLGVQWLFIGSIIFGASFIIPQINKKSDNFRSDKYIYNPRTLSKLTTLSLYLRLVTFILSFYIVLNISGDIYRIFLESSAVRDEYLHREDDGSLITSLNLLLSINNLCLFCLYPQAVKAKCPRIKTKLFLELIICLLGSIVTMSKESFIFSLLILISSYSMLTNDLNDEKRFIRKYSIYFISLIIILFYVIALQRNYTEERYGNYAEAIVGTFLTYLSEPISAFYHLISLPSPYYVGEQCFRPIYNILSRFGLGERTSIVQDNAVEDVNVYSVFGNMYNDFGEWGVVLISVIWGSILGFIYRKGHVSKFSSITINSLILPTMFFGYYDFKLSQTIYPFTMFYVIFLERFLRKRMYQVVENEINK